MKPLLFALLLLFSHLGHAADCAGIVAFGDSLSDMGNRWMKAGMDDSKIRATWVRQLAGPTLLNIPGFKVSGMTSYLGGTNYAVGGAGTEFTAKMAGERNRGQHLTAQVSERYLNPAFNTDGVRKDALHIIIIGANDLMLASTGLDQIVTQWAGLDKVGAGVAQSTEGQIQALAAAGVTHVLWGNVFNVAQAPSVVTRAKALGGTLSAKYLAAVTNAAIAHNKEMDAAIARLEKANPSLRILKLDLFAKFAEVAAEPAKFGFSDVTTGANDSRHLFSADGLHPSQQGHRMLAEYAFSVISGARPGAKTARAAALPVAK
jgi:phospholipase/lecithinase/hemolysin